MTCCARESTQLWDRNHPAGNALAGKLASASTDTASDSFRCRSTLQMLKYICKRQWTCKALLTVGPLSGRLPFQLAVAGRVAPPVEEAMGGAACHCERRQCRGEPGRQLSGACPGLVPITDTFCSRPAVPKAPVQTADVSLPRPQRQGGLTT